MPTNNNTVSSSIIYNELSNRANAQDSMAMVCRLKSLLDTIMHDSEGHLSRVNHFLPEFDDHSVNHSKSVLDIIDQIIGKNGIKELSIYDLFILAASAYLHDWGMALTGYEEEVLKLAEKEPLPVATPSIDECKQIINENASSIFGKQLEDALKVNILPCEKAELFEFLADLYQEYQNFRNGYTEKYRNAKDESEKIKLNKDIQMDFIREKHHEKSAVYVKNWNSRIKAKDTSLSEVMNDVEKVVRSHGESYDSIQTLNKNAQYEVIDNKKDSDVANLQFASMMLRLGDIAHFTYERAPSNLRKEIKFDSSISREQWMVKTGVSNKITKSKNQTTITFKAACVSPRSYCYLKTYIGYINREIDLFNTLKSEWENRYQIPLAQVDDKVKPLNDEFETRTDLTFTLNQNKIIELLMGVQLYKDPYTCLRELYQNSLDACRCAISRRKSQGEKNPICTIEFGVKEDKGGKYIYCLDDGKGMSRHIIEQYFLKIGSSYYKSKEFFTEWAKSGFTPTSQFGIGILSCFMIGDRLEVVTKEYEGELISFGVDGPQETFYYWHKNKISSSKKETFKKRPSGTLVKVYLKEQYANEIDDGKLDKLELLKCIEEFNDDKLDDYNPSDAKTDYETEYVNLFKRWKKHFYKKIFDFVQIPFPDIHLQVCFANQTHPIEARPHLANVDLREFEKDKKMFEDYSYYSYEHYKDNSHIVKYPIQICHSNYIYHSMLCLPTEDKDDYDFTPYPHAGKCVDGVRIDSFEYEYNIYDSTLDDLTVRGVFNFVGEHKPLIKVDRCSFVNAVHIDEAEQLFADYLDEVIQITNEHIKKHNIGIGSPFYQKIWTWVIKELPDSLQILLTNHFDEQGYPQIVSEKLSAFMGINENVPAILSIPSIKPPYNNLKFQQPDVFLLKKLSAINSIVSTQEGELQLEFNELPTLPFSTEGISIRIISIPNDVGLFIDYDMVDYYYPLVSHRLAGKTTLSSHLYRFTMVFDDIIHDIHRNTHQLTIWSQLRSFEFQNKTVGVYQVDTRISRELLLLSNTVSYISLFIHSQETNKNGANEEYSIIVSNDNINHIIVVNGKLKRKEMEKIIDYVSHAS